MHCGEGGRKSREFYIPHKPESRKVRIVYDASVRENEKAPSFNECFDAVQSLQKLTFNCSSKKSILPSGNYWWPQATFLQVWIKAHDRGALRFNWFEDLKSKQVETLRFTRALFGLVPSPFLLGGVIKQHLELCREKYPVEFEKSQRNLYVGDLIGERLTSASAIQLKETS